MLFRIGQHTQVKQVYGLTQQFIEMVNQRQASKLDQWLKDCKLSKIMLPFVLPWKPSGAMGKPKVRSTGSNY